MKSIIYRVSAAQADPVVIILYFNQYIYMHSLIWLQP